MTAPARRGGRVSLGAALATGPRSVEDMPALETSARLEDLAANPHNPRDSYAGEALDELAASMREVGQLQPLAVVGRDVWLGHYPDEAEQLGSARWVVLTGNRRLAAAPAAGLERMDITVKDRLAGADPRLSEAMLIENLHREGLPPLLEARELQALVERHGSQSGVAKRLGKSQGWVSQRLSLLRLTPALQSAMESGQLSVEDGRRVAAAPAEEQAARLAELRSPTPQPESASGRRAGTTDSRRSAPRSRPSDPEPVEPDVDALATDLRARLSGDKLTRLVELLSEGPITP